MPKNTFYKILKRMTPLHLACRIRKTPLKPREICSVIRSVALD
jgi:hypothetical protein